MTEKSSRAEIIETGNPKVKAARILIQAEPSLIFSFLNNPKLHKEIADTTDT